jgi:hypothetical protein
MPKAKLRNAVLILISSLILGAVYQRQIAITYAYMGYLPDIFSWKNLAHIVPLTILVTLFVPSNIQRPSDCFLLFYAVIVLFSCALFSQVTGEISSTESILLFLLLSIPVGFVSVFRRVAFPANLNGLLKSSAVYYLLAIIVVAAIVAGTSADTGAGFGWESMYDRRLLGRESIGSRNITAYLLTMTMNGIGPFLAYAGVLTRRHLLVLCGLLSGVFAFWLLGLKTPFVLSLFFIVVGYYVRNQYLYHLPTLVVTLLVSVGLLAVGELIVFDHSLVAELVIRRAFVIQGALQSYYFDLIGQSLNQGFYNFLVGVDSSPYQSVTFLVGAEYLGRETINANTNAYLHAFASGGLIFYLSACFIVAIFFAFTDGYHGKMQRADVFFVAALYGLLLTEQAFTTALVSSGVGLVFLSIVLMRREKTKSKRWQLVRRL